jgi:hypothetical protein
MAAKAMPACWQRDWIDARSTAVAMSEFCDPFVPLIATAPCRWRIVPARCAR